MARLKFSSVFKKYPALKTKTNSAQRVHFQDSFPTETHTHGCTQMFLEAVPVITKSRSRSGLIPRVQKRQRKVRARKCPGRWAGSGDTGK